MSAFQIIILLVVALVILKSARRLWRKEISPWLFLIWLSFWLAVALVNIFPEIINRLADWLGVGRGVDLLIYLALLALFYLIFKISVKINRLNQDVAKIISALAITDRKTSKKNEEICRR